MMNALVEYEVSNGVARVTLDRPEARNALSIEMVEMLKKRIDAAVSDPSAHLVWLGAAGPAFCAGMDLKSVELSHPAQAARFARALSGLYCRLLTLPMPLLCSVDGPVAGGGVGLVAAADLVWAGPKATFALPETRLGFVPALASVVLRRRLSPQRLSGMALSGISFDANQALIAGLADFAAENSAAAEADQFARSLLRDHSPGAMSRTKTFLVNPVSTALRVEFVDAEREFLTAAGGEEAQRGLTAFRRKESVRWDAE